MKKTMLSLLLTCLTLLSLTACLPPGRGGKTESGTTPDHVLAIELRTDHELYDYGEPVNVYVKLANISNQTVTLHSRSENEPVLDIIVQRGPALNPTERRVWSQEHPREVLYSLTLAPGQSYELEWTQMLSEREGYRVEMVWIDNLGFTRKTRVSIWHGVDLPG